MAAPGFLLPWGILRVAGGILWENHIYPNCCFLSAFCLCFVGLLILGSNLFMERAIFPAAITMPLHHNRFPLLIGEVDRHRQSGKPLAPNINPITCPVEWASHINTFPTGSHRYPSEIACALMVFCLHHNAGFRHGFDTVIVGKNSVYCPCFVTRKNLFFVPLLIHF